VTQRSVTNASASLNDQGINWTRPIPEPEGPAELVRLGQPHPPFGAQRPETAMAALRQGEQRRGSMIRPAEAIRRGQGGPQVVLGQIVMAEERCQLSDVRCDRALAGPR